MMGRDTSYRVMVEKREYGFVGVAVFLDEESQMIMKQDSICFNDEGVALVRITAMAKALQAVLATGRRGA